MAFEFGAILVGLVLLALALQLPKVAAPYLAALGFVGILFGLEDAILNENWAVVAFVGALLLLAVALVRERRARRRRSLELFAAARDLQFSARDPFDIPSQAFDLFSLGDGRRAENVLSGSWRGVNMKACDFAYFRVKGAWAWWRLKDWHRYSVAIAETDVSAPAVTIAPETLLSDLEALAATQDQSAETALWKVLGRDIDFESEEFNRAFRVRSRDPEFATKLVDPRMMEWLLENGRDYAFEIRGRRLLASHRRMAPHDVPRLLDVAVGFCAHIPRVVLRENAADGAPEGPIR